MNFILKKPDNSVNITKESPVKEFFTVLCGLFLFVFIIYILLGFFVDLIVLFLPDSLENQLQPFFLKKYCLIDTDKIKDKNIIKINNILNKLLANEKFRKLNYKIYLSKQKKFNALAFPGGAIVIYNKLLKEIKSENELAFVLAHELGHFQYRDNLRGLGRGILTIFLSLFLSSSENSMAQGFINNAIKNSVNTYSRSQEKKADLFALDLLNKKYGHIGGSFQFLEKLSSINSKLKLTEYFSTHPNPKTRIKYIKTYINQKKYLSKSLLFFDFKNIN